MLNLALPAPPHPGLPRSDSRNSINQVGRTQYDMSGRVIGGGGGGGGGLSLARMGSSRPSAANGSSRPGSRPGSRPSSRPASRRGSNAFLNEDHSGIGGGGDCATLCLCLSFLGGFFLRDIHSLSTNTLSRDYQL